MYADSRGPQTNESEFQIGLEDIEILDLGAHPRKNMWMKEKGTYWFCVYGVVTSTYSLKVIEFEEERGARHII